MERVLVYACGDGQLYQGNAKEIANALKKALEEAKKDTAQQDKVSKIEKGLEIFLKQTNPTEYLKSKNADIKADAPSLPQNTTEDPNKPTSTPTL